MKREQGLSLLELLIAIAILVVVLGMASAGVVLALQAQRGQEAVTSSQAKLRRVNEAVLQELRGAVLGGVTSDPIEAGPNSVSFTVMDGGAGYAVQAYNPSQITAVAPLGLDTVNDFDNAQILMVNNEGIARVLNTRAASAVNANNVFTLDHTPCTNAFPHTDDILMFKIRTVGFVYNQAERELEQQVGSGDKLPLAYGMSKFDIDYVYQKDDGSYIIRNDPYLDADKLPDRTGTIGVDNVNLARLNITLGTSAPSIGGRTVNREYTGQLELLDTARDSRFRAVKGVAPCN